MRGHADEMKPGMFPLRIAHHRIKMTMSCVPTAVIFLCQTFNVHGRPCNHIRHVDSYFAAAAYTQKKLVVLHRTNNIIYSLQVRREHTDFVKDASAKRDVSSQ